MKINRSLHALIHALIFTSSGDVRKMRVKGLKKIFKQNSINSNLSQFITRVKDKSLDYQQSKQLIKWFGVIVYDMKTEEKHSKVVSGHIETKENNKTIYEYKSFVCDCRVMDVYFDAMLNDYIFSRHQKYNRVVFTPFTIIDEVANAKSN